MLTSSEADQRHRLALETYSGCRPAVCHHSLRSTCQRDEELLQRTKQEWLTALERVTKQSRDADMKNSYRVMCERLTQDTRFVPMQHTSV